MNKLPLETEMTEMLELAKKNLCRAKQLLPFLIADSQDIIPVTGKNGDEISAFTQKYVRQRLPKRAILIHEVYMRAMKPENHTSYRYGDLAKDPQAKEAISVVGWEDGQAYMTMQIFEKDSNGAIVFPEPAMEITAVSQTRMFPLRPVTTH